MKIAVSGATGLIGTRLCRGFKSEGHAVVAISRQEHPGYATWNPTEGTIDAGPLEGVEAVFHLAGESVNGRWTSEKKRRLRASRLRGTELLVNTLMDLKQPPRVFISASAIGFYGPGPHEGVLTEDSPAGDSFLAEICREWEIASRPLREAGIRLVHARIGIVLSRDGGALASMLPVFRLGLGGPVGDGTQRLPWIHEADIEGALRFCLENEAASGPINFVGPEPVSFNVFARSLGKTLRRPAFLPAPAFAVRLLLGEMADELLLADYPVVPEALNRLGYSFAFPALEGALGDLAGRKAG